MTNLMAYWRKTSALHCKILNANNIAHWRYRPNLYVNPVRFARKRTPKIAFFKSSLSFKFPFNFHLLSPSHNQYTLFCIKLRFSKYFRPQLVLEYYLMYKERAQCWHCISHLQSKCYWTKFLLLEPMCRRTLLFALNSSKKMRESSIIISEFCFVLKL